MLPVIPTCNVMSSACIGLGPENRIAAKITRVRLRMCMVFISNPDVSEDFFGIRWTIHGKRLIGIEATLRSSVLTGADLPDT